MRYDFSRLGENIAALRRASGLTQELLADRLGVTSQAVSKWERQLSCPDVSLLPAMAEVFGVDIDELFLCGEADPAARIEALPWEDEAASASPSSRASASAPARSTNAPTARRWCCSSATRRGGTPCPSGW
jgi:transcriptional regulator with XRE-family HTH domain